MVYKKHLVLIGIILSIGLIGFSQGNNHNKIVTTLDIGGSSGLYSINGEYRLISKDKYSISSRVGFGYFPLKSSNFMTIPIALNLMAGKGKHHMEGGLGTSYIKGLTIRTIGNGDSQDLYLDEAVYFAPSIGYRFDKLTKGLIFKIYYSPLIVVHDLYDEDSFIDEVTQGMTIGSEAKKVWFDYFFGNDFKPKAESKFGYLGFTIGYRF